MTHKFRAWDKKDKEMIGGDNFYICQGHILIFGKDDNLRYMNDWVLMQSTGITSKNHLIYIYQDDYVISGDDPKPRRVIFKDGGFSVEGFYSGSQEYPIMAFSENTQFEIVGNYWENPEFRRVSK